MLTIVSGYVEHKPRARVRDALDIKGFSNFNDTSTGSMPWLLSSVSSDLPITVLTLGSALAVAQPGVAEVTSRSPGFTGSKPASTQTIL